MFFVCAFLLVAAAYAAGPKTYQVTGPVLDVKGDVIAVKKGSDNREVARSAATRVTGDVKAGARVTIEYTMTATKIEVKEDKKAKAEKKK
ncbi:MAG: hypothetical protein GX874_05265 [Smithella sp.]|nr:hypothetical protein [Smithella sp.]